MTGVRRLVTALPMVRVSGSENGSGRHIVTYADKMMAAVEKVRTAELQMEQAGTLDELDLGRCALQQAHAEIQHVIRSAKRELGIPVREIGESEAMYRRLMLRLKRLSATVGAGDGLAEGLQASQS